MKKIALSLALFLAATGSALAQTCPGGSTCNPIESYVYSSPTATTPLVSSLRIPIIPSTSASTMQYTPANTWPQAANNLSDLANLSTGLNNLTTAALSGSGTACIHANSAGLLTRASGDCATGGSGSVTSVNITVPSFLTIGGVPITTAGTAAFGLANQLANTVFAGPGSGAASTPGFRSLVVSDLPTSGVTPGSYTNPTVTFDAQGRATAASNGAAGGTTVWTGTVTGTNTYVSSSVQGSFANGPYKMFCGTFANASTAAATLAVDSAGALPIDIQFGQTPTTQAGPGDIQGGNTSLCLQQNTGGTAWVKQTQVPGGVLLNPSAHTVSAFEWSTGYTFVFTTGTPTLTFPSVSGTLSSQGGIVISTSVPLTLTPAAADGINGLAINTSVTMSAGVVTIASTNGSGGVGTIQVPLGEPKLFTFTYGPNQNLATVAFPLATRGITSSVTNITCTPGGVAPASSSIDVWFAADAVTAANVTSSGTKLTTTACNANSASGTQQGPLNSGVVSVPSGSHLWVVGSGAGWAGSLAAVSGLVQVAMTP